MYVTPAVSHNSCVTRQVPYNEAAMDCVWGGLWMGLTYTAAILVALVYTIEGHGTAEAQSLVAYKMTWVSSSFCLSEVESG